MVGLYVTPDDKSVEVRLKWGSSYNSYDTNTSQPCSTIAVLQSHPFNHINTPSIPNDIPAGT
eukprot:54108-Eustigmatos_ZCMA.PRE.1